MAKYLKWAGVDLDRPAQEIADEMGCTIGAVYSRRARSARSARSEGPVDWNSVGLGARTDAEIAAEIGRSASRVGEMRRELGIRKFDIIRNKKKNKPPRFGQRTCIQCEHARVQRGVYSCALDVFTGCLSDAAICADFERDKCIGEDAPGNGVAMNCFDGSGDGFGDG